MRQALAVAPIRLSPGEIPITASLGAAGNANSVVGILDSIRNADTAMYAAKFGGRNRTMAYAAELEKSTAATKLYG